MISISFGLFLSILFLGALLGIAIYIAAEIFIDRSTVKRLKRKYPDLKG